MGAGSCRHVDVALPAGLLARRAGSDSGDTLFLHNLGTAASFERVWDTAMPWLGGEV